MGEVKFHFSDARVWRYMVASIEKIIDEGVFIATPEGLSLRAMDTSRVVMVDLFYPASSFIDYNVEEEKEFGVSFGVLAKVLRRARKDDELVILVDESRVTVKLRSRGERTFRIPQAMLTYEKLPEPKIQFTVKAKMLGSTFREVVKDIELLSESVTLRASENTLYMVGRSDIASIEAELSIERGSLIDLIVDSQDQATYSIEYFTQMTSAAQAADSVTLQYSEDAPARVDFEYLGGGRLTFYVSPRIE